MFVISACDCSPVGSNSVECEQTTGQCPCGSLFTSRDCSSCIEGYGNVTAGCRECDCDVGALDGICDPINGECRCTPGVVGLRCERCDMDHYGLSTDGCKGKCQHRSLYRITESLRFSYRNLALLPYLRNQLSLEGLSRIDLSLPFLHEIQELKQ